MRCGGKDIFLLTPVQVFREQYSKILDDRLFHDLDMAAWNVADFKVPQNQILPFVMDRRIKGDRELCSEQDGISVIRFRTKAA